MGRVRFDREKNIESEIVGGGGYFWRDSSRKWILSFLSVEIDRSGWGWEGKI